MALNSSVACAAATGDVTHSYTYLQVDTLVADLTEAIAAAAAAGTLIDNIDVDPDSIVVENGTRSRNKMCRLLGYFTLTAYLPYEATFSVKLAFLFQKMKIVIPRLVNKPSAYFMCVIRQTLEACNVVLS